MTMRMHKFHRNLKCVERIMFYNGVVQRMVMCWANMARGEAWLLLDKSDWGQTYKEMTGGRKRDMRLATMI